MFLVRAHVNALDFKSNYGLMERGRDLLRWTFSFPDAPLAVANNIFLLMLCSFANQVLAQLVLLRYCSMRKQQNGTFLHPLLRHGTSLNGSCALVEVFLHELPCQAEHATPWWLPQVV